jgi:hypothetical protein
MKHLKVLLVGRGLEKSIALLSRLARHGCQYQSATPLWEANRLIRKQVFDLVLNGISEGSHNARSLREALREMPTTLLYSCPVEEGCWWIICQDRGTQCLGEAPAIRNREFFEALDLIIEELAADRMVLPRISTWLSCAEPHVTQTQELRSVSQPKVA